MGKILPYFHFSFFFLSLLYTIFSAAAVPLKRNVRICDDSIRKPCNSKIEMTTENNDYDPWPEPDYHDHDSQVNVMVVVIIVIVIIVPCCCCCCCYAFYRRFSEVSSENAEMTGQDFSAIEFDTPLPAQEELPPYIATSLSPYLPSVKNYTGAQDRQQDESLSPRYNDNYNPPAYSDLVLTVPPGIATGKEQTQTL